MKRLVDLHTHTNASDGQYTPTELVNKAKVAGIDCLAVTDHDTVDGLAEALAAGENLGVTVLSGVEFGASGDRHLHILGLGFQTGPSPLTELCRQMKKSREQHKHRLIDFLAERGVRIPLSEVEELAGRSNPGRPHFAQVMVRHDYVSTNREAFDKYLDTEEYQKIDRVKATAVECIAAIHAAGGKAVLAHPYQLGYFDEKLEALISELKSYGLDGLECYYPKHTPEQVRQYLALAQKYALHVTAGSDFHGECVKPDVVLVPTELDVDWLF